MVDSAAAYRVSKLSSLRAAPRIVAVYTADHGWLPPAPVGLRLTPESAARLHADGVRIVTVRHRFRTVQIRLRRYLA